MAENTTVGHTPGPWMVTGVMLGHKGDVYAPTADRIPDCHHIARCFAPKPQGEVYCELQAIGIERDAIAQIEANARLIAAAPELYEALKEVRRRGLPDRYTSDAELIAQVDAALLKASPRAGEG